SRVALFLSHSSQLTVTLRFVFLYVARAPRALHSFPTRRSSDLPPTGPVFLALPGDILKNEADIDLLAPTRVGASRSMSASFLRIDRKSTRLNSSHEWISYAVFCLKKKKKITRKIISRERTPNHV